MNTITSEDASTFTTDGKFDTKKFNDSFLQLMDKNKQLNRELEDKKLAELNNSTITKHLYQSTLSELFSGVKTTWFGLLDDLLEFDFSFNIFTKNNRLFFMGLTFLVIGVILYLYNFFVMEEETIKPVEKIIEIHHNWPNDVQQNDK